MNWKLNLIALWAGLAASALGAAVPPAEQLLPADTVFMLTVPDWSKAAATYHESPAAQLWRDAEMKPFKDKFTKQFQSQALDPLERELGVKCADYVDLLQGQVTVAVLLKNDDAGKPAPGWLLLVDTKDKSEQLKKNLADLRKKWVDSGKKVKSEKIRDLEFSTLTFTADDVMKVLRSAFVPDKAKEAGSESGKLTNSLELIVGQSDSLLLLGSSAQDLEKVLVRQSGGQTPALAEQGGYQASQGLFRNAMGYGWLNLKPLVTLAIKALTDASAGAMAANPMMPKIDKLTSGLGLDGLRTLSGSLTVNAEGEFVQLFLNLPESDRKGLFKMFSFENKNANPPPFVPSDAVKFNRWRLDSQKMWATLEATLNDISPQIGGFLQTMLSMAGKDKDPNFDLKKSLIGNLGDDFLGYEKSPRTYTLAALNSPPSLFLMGSPQADQLMQALKTGLGMVMPVTNIKEREFLGRKIFSLPMPSAPGAVGAEDKTLSLAASGGYLAFSTDDAALEEYLRSSQKKPKSLEETPGLKEAAEKVGGMSTGLWGYENQSETMRAVVETLKKDSDALQKILNLGPLGSGAGKLDLKAWFDFALLPPFERIAKYFSFMVYSGATTSEGLNVKFFTPTPPALR